MKKIILKTTVFVLPFIIIHLIGNIFYLKIPGDLIRVGLIYSIPGYRDVFSTKITINSVTQVSELSKTNKRKFDFIFLDPPFANNDYIENLKKIKSSKIYNDNHIVIIHRENKTIDNFENILKPIVVKEYGRSKIIFGRF